MSSGRWKGIPRWFLALALFALGVRAALWLQHGASPFGQGLLLDEEAYWRWGEAIAGGAWKPVAAFPQGPLYPYLLGTARAIFPGLTPAGVGAFQLLVNWGACLLFLPLMERWTGERRLGLAAASLALLFAPAAFFALKLHAVTLGLLLLALSLFALPVDGKARGRAALSGVLAGLACLSVPFLLAALPALALGAASRAGRSPLHRALAPGLVLGGALLAILPATLSNLSRGEAVLVSSNFGVTFLQGNNPRAQGIYTAVPGVATHPLVQEGTSAVLARGQAGRALATGEVARALAARGVEFIRSQPLSWLRLEAQKAVLAFGGLDVPLESSLARERRDFLWTLWLLPLGGTALLALAATGAATRPRAALLPALVCLSLAAIPLLFFAANRYLLPFQFMAIPLAAPGILLFFRRPVPWGPFLAGIPVALFALLSLVPLGSFYQETVYGSRLMALHAATGQGGKALAVYRRLAAAGPLPPGIMRMAARTMAETGDRAGAEETLRQALALAPEEGEGVVALASFLREGGRRGEALALYERWLARHPDDLYAGNQVAESHLEAGEWSKAEAASRRLIAAAPWFPAGHLVLGVALRRQGREEEGVAQIEAAIRLDPRYPAPHFALGLDALEKGDLPSAREHLRKAAQLGFPLPAPVAARAGLGK